MKATTGSIAIFAGVLCGLAQSPAFSASNLQFQAYSGAPMRFEITGRQRPEFAALDAAMIAYMIKHNIPGGALAVSKNGRLVYARGYGVADFEKREIVQPESLFRIASISKCFTAAAILTLVQQKKLSLDDKVFPMLGLKPLDGKPEDPRLKRITVRQLLQHRGGWDMEQSPAFDPMFNLPLIASAAGVISPPPPDSIIRYMLGRPLDFDPGSRSAYSNFGYCVLGRVIEHVSGMSYEDYVKRYVLEPAGIKDMEPGKTNVFAALPGEVHYYQPEAGLKPSVFAQGGLAPAPYGGELSLEAMDANGGWVASVIDLVKFAAALDFPNGAPLLTPEMMAATCERPVAVALTKSKPVHFQFGRHVFSRLMHNGDSEDTYFGLGWCVRDLGRGKHNLWMTGAMSGTSGELARRSDGVAWAVLFNTRPHGESVEADINRCVDAIKWWPQDDLFGKHGLD